MPRISMLHLVCIIHQILFIYLSLLDASAENEEENEEIFAESYDEREDHQSSSAIPKKVLLIITKISFDLFIFFSQFQVLSQLLIFK